MSQFRLTNLVLLWDLIQLIKNADTFGVIRGNTAQWLARQTTSHCVTIIKALRAAEQQRAMTDNNKRYELKLRPATRYNVAKSART